MADPTLFLIGDSISIQYDIYLKQYLRGRCTLEGKRGEAEVLRNLDIPTGANGGDSGMVLKYLRAAPEHGEIGSPDAILINCGLHDIKSVDGKRQVEPELYRANLEGIVAAAGVLARTCIWIRTTPLNEKIHNSRQTEFSRFERDLETYNRIADEVMERRRIATIDLHRFTLALGPGEELWADHVHFPAEVQRLQAAYIAGRLEREL